MSSEEKTVSTERSELGEAKLPNTTNTRNVSGNYRKSDNMQFTISDSGQKIKAFPNGRALCPNCKTELIAKCGDFNIWHWAHANLNDCDSWKYEPKSEWHIKWQDYFGNEQSEVFIKKNNVCHRADIVTKTGVVIEIQNAPISTTDISSRESFYDKMIWVVNSKSFKHNFYLRNYSYDIRDIWTHWVEQYPYGSKFEFSVIVPKDDNSGLIEKAVIANNFIKSFDKKKNTEYWYNERVEYNPRLQLPKDIFNAFCSYLLDIGLVNLDNRLSYDTVFRWSYHHKVWTTAKKPIFIDLNNGNLFYIRRLYESGSGFGSVVSVSKFLKKYSE